jgi:hypothetical protein
MAAYAAAATSLSSSHRRSRSLARDAIRYCRLGGQRITELVHHFATREDEDRGTVSDLVAVSATDVFPLFRRDGVVDQRINLHRVRIAPDREWEWIADPVEVRPLVPEIF